MNNSNNSKGSITVHLIFLVGTTILFSLICACRSERYENFKSVTKPRDKMNFDWVNSV